MAFLHKVFSRRTFAFATGGTALVLGGGYWYLNSGPAYPVSTKTTRRPPPPWTPPLRSEMLKALKASGTIKTLNSQAQNTSREEEEFDLLIVGGGATGAGCAVDAASRGLKVALVERDDFAAGKVVFALVPPRSSLYDYYFFRQVPRPNLRNSFMEAFVTSKKLFSNSTTTSTNSSRKLCTNDAFSCKRLHTSLICCPLCCRFISTGKFLITWRGVRCMTGLLEKKTWSRRIL